jgi:hypothetical protein
MAFQLLCPHCQTKLTVSDRAQQRLTCPRCLAPLLNPYAVDSSQPMAPRPVIPLEQQIARDQSLSRGGLIAIIVLLTIGGLVIIGVRSKRETDGLAGASTRPGPPPPIPGTLSYQRAQDRNDGPTVLRFTGGFFTAIGVCAGCVILLGATVDFQPKSAHVLFLGIVLAAVVGLILLTTSVRRIPGWSGFGLGVTVGLVLGMMALGPCGFCYLMTLG